MFSSKSVAKGLGDEFVTKVVQISGNFCVIYNDITLLWLLLENLGYFLFHHLVTLSCTLRTHILCAVEHKT